MKVKLRNTFYVIFPLMIIAILLLMYIQERNDINPGPRRKMLKYTIKPDPHVSGYKENETKKTKRKAEDVVADTYPKAWADPAVDRNQVVKTQDSMEFSRNISPQNQQIKTKSEVKNIPSFKENQRTKKADDRLPQQQLAPETPAANPITENQSNKNTAGPAMKSENLAPKVSTFNINYIDENSDVVSEESRVARGNIGINKTRQHEDRIQKFHTMCANPKKLEKGLYKRQMKSEFYHSDTYNFSLCIIPKAGSTAWIQVFGILEYGVKFGIQSTDLSRLETHSLNYQFSGPFPTTATNTLGTILISRDPYTRLFSAFIDKIYVPLVQSAKRQIHQLKTRSKSEVDCPGQPTFEDFVRSIIYLSKSRDPMNRHWAPIYSMCNPCRQNPLMLVKLESFSNDVEYGLRKVGVESDKLNTILDSMHGNRVETTIPGIVIAVFDITERNRRCYDKFEISSKLWDSFKLQGYLDEKVVFPRSEFERRSLNKQTVSPIIFNDVILRAIKANPISSTEAKLQRTRALVKAYRGFSDETIKGIQRVYYEDFVLFDYSMEPPTMNS